VSVSDETNTEMKRNLYSPDSFKKMEIEKKRRRDGVSKSWKDVEVILELRYKKEIGAYRGKNVKRKCLL